MNSEKIIAFVLAIIVIGIVTGFFFLAYGDELFDNLNPDDKDDDSPDDKDNKYTKVSYEDYVDLNYIGKYSSNDTIFSTSYDDPVAKTGGAPLKVFVNDSIIAEPNELFVDYINSPLRAFSIEEYIELMKSPVGTNKGFFEELTNAKINPEDGTFTTGDIPPEKAYGISVKMNSLINLTPLSGEWLEYEVVNIQYNEPMPQEIFDIYGDAFGETTTIFTLGENMHYIGKEVVEKYPNWQGSTIITKLNETKMWMYTTPPDDLEENFTWADIDQETGEKIDYPVNTSSIESINEDTIIIVHNPKKNDTITESIYYSMYGMYLTNNTYTVEYIDDDKINISYDDGTGNKSYKEISRFSTVERNETQDITQELAGDILEVQLLFLRLTEDTFTYSYHPLSDETVYFEIEIVEIQEIPSEEDES